MNWKIRLHLEAVSIPVADVFINIVGETATVFGWGIVSYDRLPYLYNVTKMVVRIEDDTICDAKINPESYASYLNETQMCGTSLLPAQEIKHVIKSINFISFSYLSLFIYFLNINASNTI